MVKFYGFLTGALDWPAGDPRIVEIADILERLMIRAGEAGDDASDDQFVALMDSTMLKSAPGAELVLAILKERGWRGWNRIERLPADRLN